MTKKYKDAIRDQLDRLVPVVLGLPWLEITAEVWKLTRNLWQGMTDEGIYEVLEHESRLEILDKKGRRARFLKRQRVKYRQNNIIAFQDHAWGDGKILIGYRCSPGVLVDQYRPGQKTFLLISLRDTKQRGDEDEFKLEWGIRDGFLRSRELWETEVRHKTRKMKVQTVFPKSRPPGRVWLEEGIRRKKTKLSNELLRKLPSPTAAGR